MRPCEPPEPLPPENAFNSPAVAPCAVAENASSPISISQVPRPTGMPESEASYTASIRPCAKASRGARPAAAEHHRPASRNRARRGETEGNAVTDERSFGERALVFIYAKNGAKQRPRPRFQEGAG